MGPMIDPVASDQHQPTHADVIIIGGGIVGVSAALSLAKRGVSVVVCEKGQIAGEQSSRNWGWCRSSIRDPREIPLALDAMRRWSGINEALQTETGFRNTGSLFVCSSDAEVAGYEAWLHKARTFGVSSQMLDGHATARHLPGANRHFKAALHTPDDGRAEPQKAAPAIAQAARRHGAVLLSNCAVRGVDKAAGAVAGVITEHGRIAAGTVVLAGGAWSRLFADSLGLRLPLLKVQGTALRTEPLPGGPEGMGWLAGFAFRKRLDGGYTIAKGDANRVSIVPDSLRFFREFLPALRTDWPLLRLRLDGRFYEEWRHWRHVELDRPSIYERVRVLDPPAEPQVNRAALQAAASVFPVFANARIAEQWAGVIDVTPDAIPVISPVDSLKGFFIAAGFSGHGFGVAPAAGQLLADLVTGHLPVVDATPFNFARLSNGSPLQPGGLVGRA